MRVSKLLQNKYKVFFRRVSSISQDLAMQQSADAIYRKQYLSKEIVIIDENAMSANKLSIVNRPAMMKIIHMIENNQVDIIYAFDRTRLFRDYYEGNYFVSLCRKKEVQIIYTSTGNGHQQSTGNIFLEGVMNIVGDFEGKNIARRSEEARRRYPAQKLGYVKDKQTKQFHKDPIKRETLIHFFLDLSKVQTYIELEKLLKTYQKKLGTKKNQLLRVARDPFYAGYDLSKGKNKLSHVEPYLTLSEFSDLQDKNAIVEKYLEKDQHLQEQNIFQVNCGICGKSLIFHWDIVKGAAWYSCARKHPKIHIFADSLTSIIYCTLEQIVNHLDIDRLLFDSSVYFRKIRQSFLHNLDILKKDKNQILQNIIMEDNTLLNWRKHPLYEELSILEEKQEQLSAETLIKEELLIGNKQLSKLVKEYLNSTRTANPFFLSTILIQNLFIYPNEVNIEVNKFDYIQNIQTHFIFEGEDFQ